MSFLRTTAIGATLMLGSVMLAGAAHATDVSMADGSVTFSTPNDWLDIMDRPAYP